MTFWDILKKRQALLRRAELCKMQLSKEERSGNAGFMAVE